MSDEPRVRSASYLSPPDFHRLDWACHPIYHAFGSPPDLVGSVATRPDFRDIDLRLILDDDRFEALTGSAATWPKVNKVGLLLNIALSGLIANAAGLPHAIDFQIQSQSEANEFDGTRNPMGMRWAK